MKRLAALLLLTILGLGEARGAEPAAPESGKLTYILVLKEPWQMPVDQQSKGKGRLPVEEPDLTKFGATLKNQWRTRREISVRPEVLEELKKHPSVYYLQRVNTGEPSTAPDLVLGESAVESRLALSTESVWSWDSGDYSYDGAGNIVAIGADQFDYDSSSRLTAATVNGTSVAYGYDAYGNLRTTAVASQPVQTAYVDVTTNRLQGVAYDRAGNQKESVGGLQRYTYDAAGMMTKKSWGLAQERWIYTANDERLGRGFLDEWDWTVRDLNGRVLSEFESRLDSLGSSSSWLWNGDYYYNEGKLSAASRPGEIGRYRYYHLDHLGTPRLLTDSRAYRLAEHEYYPFGLEQTSWAQEIETYGHARIDDLKFTSHERDFLDPRSTWTQEYLDYMHARHYNPKWGRFLSVDPLRDSARPNQPQTWNRYAYVRNNPINRVDRNGLIDVRSDQDKQVTEAPATLVTSSQLIDSTSQGVEYGAILGANGKVSSGVFTSNDPGFVDPRQGVDLTGPSPRVKGTNELPTHSMHTHLAAGKYKVPGTNMIFEATTPGEPSSGDKQMAKATVPGFIVVPGLRQVIKVEKDGSFKVVLSEKDYDAWAKRAAAAVTDKEEKK